MSVEKKFYPIQVKQMPRRTSTAHLNFAVLPSVVTPSVGGAIDGAIVKWNWNNAATTATERTSKNV
jgi:hypothetical protein